MRAYRTTGSSLMFDIATATPDEVRAEAARREKCRAQGLPFSSAPSVYVKSEAEIDRDRMKWEREIQQKVCDVYRAFGCMVYSRSVPKMAKVTPGQPDLKVFHAPSGKAWEHETKTRDGRLSLAQQDYRDLCAATGLLWVSGGRGAAEEMLVALGIAVRVGDYLESVRSKPKPIEHDG